MSIGFQPSTPADQLLPLAGAPAHVADRLTDFARVWDGVRRLLTLSKQSMADRPSRQAPIFVPGGLVVFKSKCVYIHSKNASINVIDVLVRLRLFKKLS